jgi:N-methylhydantoinase A
VTDANVVLGYLNPDCLAGGALALDAEAARRQLRALVARPLDLDLAEAAWGIHRISNATMVRAVRAVSIERGRDPRRFLLLAFGGSGPVHAAHLAQEMGIGRVVVPPAPGLFSALGLLCSELEYHHARTFWRRLAGVTMGEIHEALDALAREAQDDLARGGGAGAAVEVAAAADLRYVGQDADLTVPLGRGTRPAMGLAALRESFEHEHEATYGYRSPAEAVQLVNLRVALRGLAGTSAPAGAAPWSFDGSLDTAAGRRDAAPARPAYFGRAVGWLDVPVVGRAALDETPQDGPLLVEEYDSTTVVPPGWRVRRGTAGSLVLDRVGA